MKLATRINSFLPQLGHDLGRVFGEFSRMGLTHVDLNYPEHVGGISAEEMRGMLSENHLELNGVALRFRKEFINGEYGNSDPHVTEKAIALTKEACDYCREAGGNVVTVWLGFDGFDYAFQIDYVRVWNQLVAAFQEVCDYAPDLKVSIEYKPFEERSFAFIDSLGLVLAMIADIDRPNIGATLDYCHMLMKHDNPAYGAAVLGARGRLYGIHLNDGYGRMDDGLMVATVSPVQTLEFLYYVRKYGYGNAIYFDTFPVIEDAVAEAERNKAMVEALDATIDDLGMDYIGEVIASNDAIRVSELVLKAIGR